MRINIINKATVAVAVFTCVAAFSSCDKYLDIQPVGKVIPTTVDDYRALLNEAYQMPQIDRAVVDFRSDIVVVRDNDTDMNVLGDFLNRVDALYPAEIDNDELNSLLTTIRNQGEEIEIKDKEIARLKNKVDKLEGKVSKATTTKVKTTKSRVRKAKIE